ncbi:MAG: serine/threonine protein kinase [Vicinamibacteria bacterium]|nr:serine/threonine protein kinase [Vicinamibacteria bacterium]
MPPAELSALETAIKPQPRPDSTGKAADLPLPATGRFAPGTVLGRRYRIAGPLGRGGMGEVFKAEDLRLGQTVALKFLPESLTGQPAALARLQSEVRLAREVTHPNVCRVHDLAEADGLTFLSMEYVDGEDLASLLRRIGRLPADKAVEIAHQMCSGLAAAHARGVLHRDLKPANVMLDGRGHVRLADFGLAGVAGAIPGHEVASGTPAYMAPEQGGGRGVSERSDIYALGLVLYEVFTGRAAFAGRTRAELLLAHQESRPTPPSSLVPDLDPAVERVILRCLEKDPSARPASVLAVAAELPGGDFLAAARAAGETPSPDMVAAAGGKGALAPSRAVALLLAALSLLACAYGIRHVTKGELVQWVPLPLGPDVLADRARGALARLGWDAEPLDRSWGFDYDEPFVDFVRERLAEAPTESPPFEALWPSPIHFWYREGSLFRPQNRWGRVSETDPTPVAGERLLRLGPGGRLQALRVFADRATAWPAAVEPDWQPLFDAAGLDRATFTAVEPRWVSPVPADRQAAWEGPLAPWPGARVRIETSALGGRPVSFEAIGPWNTPVPAVRTTSSVGAGILGLSAAMLAGSAWLARRNLRLGRGDRTGARRLASFLFTVVLLQWLFGASHASSFPLEWRLFVRAVGYALFDALTMWLYYLAIEPYVRRLWPESIVSWSRLLAGRLDDPLVGRDILIGLSCGCLSLCLAAAFAASPTLFGDPIRLSTHPALAALAGHRHLLAALFAVPTFALQLSLLYLTLFLLLRVTLGNAWLAGTVSAAAASVSGIGMLRFWFGPTNAVDWLVLLVSTALLVGLVARFGLLAMIVAYVPSGFAFSGASPSYDLGAWTAGAFLLPPVVLLALAAWGFRTALAGQPLLRSDL